MFYVLALLIVLAALATVLAPSLRLVLIAVMTCDVLVGVLLIAAGAYLLGAIAVAAPALCLAVIVLLLRRAGYAPLLADLPSLASGWPAGIAAAAGIGILLVWVGATRVSDQVSASSSPGLVTVLHYRTPIALGVSAVLALVAVGGGLMLGRTGDDERLLDRAADQRRLREERSNRRRVNRAAARALRSRPGGGR